MSNRFPTKRALAGQQSKTGPKYQPANDNLPRNRPLKMPGRPLPANDNFPGRLPKAPSGIPPRLYRRLAGRMLLRGLPLFGWAWTAWEVYNLWKDWGQYRVMWPPVGWRKTNDYTNDLEKTGVYGRPDTAWAGPRVWTWQGAPGGLLYTASNPPGPDGFPNASPHYQWDYVSGGNPTYAPYAAVRSRWERITGEPLYLPPRPVWIPYSVPYYVPGVPLLPLAPMPVPVPKPVRWPGVFFPPDIHNPDPVGNREPGLKYRRRPGQQTQNKPDDKPVQVRRPRRKEKERKVTGNKKHLQFLGWILSQYSEVGDLVDALHSALPEKLQVQGSIKDKLKALYQHWAEVDMTQAVQNMVEDMVTDPKFAGVFEEMQERQEEFGLDLGGLKGLEGSSGIWTAR